MRLSSSLPDGATLAELGQRFARRRIARGLTQQQLADAAGVAKRTVERLEGGRSVQMVTLVRLCRVLELTAELDRLIPETHPEPMALLQQQLRTAPPRRARARSSRRQSPGDEVATRATGWTWGEDT